VWLPVLAQCHSKDKRLKHEPRMFEGDNMKMNGIIFVACYHSDSLLMELKQLSGENIYRFNTTNTKTRNRMDTILSQFYSSFTTAI
jgi:hypothetical protein